MPHRILLAESERAARLALEELLRDEGYRVTSASNGAEALAELEATGADLLLLDLIVATAGAEAFLDRVRSQHPELPTILMVSLPADEPRVAQALQDPSIKAIPKPLDLDSLFDAVQTALAS